MGLSNYLSLPRSLQCNLDRIFNYKTIWLMAVLPLSMSLIFSTIVTLIFHLYYSDILHSEFWASSLYPYREYLLGVIITPLVIVRHLGR